MRGARPTAADLYSQAPIDVRVIEPRLSSGFRWAPLADAQNRREARVKLLGVTARLARDYSTGDVPRTGRLAATAQLLTGAASPALAALRALPETHRDAAWWNDVAAAHYVLAVEGDSPDHLTRALASIDEALRLDPAAASSLFNRALIVERFHFRVAAAEAWRKYLAADAYGGWADEGRRHLWELTRPKESFDAAAQLYAFLGVGDRSAAEALVRIDAGEARYFGECEVLARWGAARLAGNAAGAAQHLAAALALGAALSARNGEVLLSEAVTAINRAAPAALDVLARGHVRFRDGRHASKERKSSDAEAMLAAAARDLEAGGSPLAAEVRFFTAVEIFDQNRVNEAQPLFAALAENLPARYSALRGYVAWMEGSCRITKAQLGGALRLFNEAIELFEHLGESSNAAFLHNITAQIYDQAHDRLRARQHRLLALRQLGKSNSFRLEHAVLGMVDDATRRKDWLAARSFLELEVEIARAVRDPELQADALLRRALVHERFGEAAAADADLRAASAVVASVTDPALREKLSVDRDATAVLVAGRPEVAIQLLTDVLRFHKTKAWRMLMPDLYLRRGRMYLTLGDLRRAAEDFESGIAELERDRETLPQGEARWGVLDAANELFEEAIDLALRDDPARAFRYAERARARALADMLPDGGNLLDPSALAADTAIVEYSLLPRKLVIFAVTRDGVRVETKEMLREEFESQLDDLVTILAGGDWKKASAPARRAYDMVVEPVGDVVGPHRHVVFVPDAAMSAVPFSALVDPATDEPLVDSRVISIAPSARAHVAARQRQAERARQSVLVFDNPANASAPALPLAATEAAEVCALYPRARRFSGAAATVDAFLTETPRYDVVHFAGHGFAGEDVAALALAGDGSVQAAAISRLRLSHTSVVILASCASARGPLRTEGALSVAYAFLQAGSPAVVATLWPISDADSAAFFPHVHRYLAQGLPAAEALRLAQLDVRRDPRNAGTTLWASVQLIGD